jgi:hypothetical protein
MRARRANFILILIVAVACFTRLPAWAQQESDSACALPPYTGDKIALVAGTDDYSIYQNEKIPNLQNAVNDARKMAGLLSKQGFVVRCLLNPTQLTFGDEKTRLALFLQDQQLNDVGVADGTRAVIYIAGHGYRDPDSDEDYLLFRFEADDKKYSKVVNLQTLTGRVAEGRWSVQTLTQSFNTAIQGVMFILDACRSVVEVPSATGIPVRAGPIKRLSPELMKGNQVVAYSTQPGGVAADGVPDSPEHNGLYASILSNFINISIFSLGHVLDLTGAVVRVNKQDQVPIYSVSAGTFFLSNPWVNNEPTDICDMLNAEIWNAAGKHCAQLKEPGCIVKDICPVVKPHLEGSTAPQAKTCLAQHKNKWLHNDLIGICADTQAQKSSGSQGAGNTVPSSATQVEFSVSGAKSAAYNVVATAEPNLTSTDVTTLALSGWANKVTSLQVAAEKVSDEALFVSQNSLDQDLANFSTPAKKLVYTNKQRDFLISKSSEGKAPPQSSPSPFKIDLTGRTITLRNLPAANAAAIATFSGDTSTAEIDCYTIPCLNSWIGVRVTKGNMIFRGWVSAAELKSVTKPGIAVEIQYDGRHIAPKSDSIEAIRRAVRPDNSKPPAPGRVHIMALRSTSDSTSSFLAGARLSYLDRVIIELGISPDDVDQTVVDLPSGSTLPPAIVNLGPLFSK